MRFHPPLVQIEMGKSSLVWCYTALCTADIPQSCTFTKCTQETTSVGIAPIPPVLTVKSLRASFERLQANSLEPASQNQHKLKTNQINVFTTYLLVLQTRLTRQLKLMRVVLTRKRDTSALYWKDSLYKFHHH